MPGQLSRFLISEAHSCSIIVPTNLISTTRGYCNQLSAPASLLPSTVLLSQRTGEFLCFSARSGWVSYNHQRRWQWLERWKWPQCCVQSLLTHCKQHVCLWPHLKETGALQRLASKQHKKKELFYQSRYCAGLFFFCCSLCIHIQVNKLPSLLQHRQGSLSDSGTLLSFTYFPS